MRRIFAAFLLGFALFAALPAGTPTKIVLRPIVRGDYSVAESLGCVEVLRTCQWRKRTGEVQ